MLGVAGIEEVCKARGITCVMHSTVRRAVKRYSATRKASTSGHAALSEARQAGRTAAVLQAEIAQRPPHPEGRSTLSRGTEPGKKGGEVG